ncbi:RagB/SusD family nutrient uptake outer membrane protein [Chitinophaga tropicalis]|uniref:RagB/SusD family nutrient uptake outer membrane protein n=1 Tax=Chitinophaga tropicalis TaxID=2683588 RepID=A0A7K1U3M0_9BACT|nr:RagB/SusD family nutrient uptake outer membrane protein [Chitinophaga tropicalis]MVT08920.1 RagB/SusD family nutrient uptake outer membrane protein [Chitinophaga tropicalis]
MRSAISKLSLILLLSFTACSQDELLNTEPDTSITAGNAFTTPSRILGLVNGAYDGVKNASFYGGRYLLYLDVRGEDFINITANSFTGFESWSNSYSSGSNDINNLWGAAYTAINLSNILIDGLSKSTGVISDSLNKQYVAEAKFIRALSYYSLVTIFARPYVEDQGASKGLPLRLQAETTSASNDLARSTVAEVYTRILADLDDAEAGLPDAHGSALLNTTRAHKSTAIALKTRVYLNQGNYARVIEESKKLVPQTTAPFSTTFGVQHKLQNIVTVFSSDYTTTESILSMPMTDLDSYTGQSSIAYIYNTNAEYYLNPSGIFGDAQWGSSDTRRSFLRLSSGRYYFQKYAKPSPFLDYIPVIRYAEVLLNYAEAAARTGNTDLSVALLKAVHSRSDATYTFAEDALGTEANLVNTIWKERRIELIGEGFRSNDLLRTLQTIPAKGSSSLQAAAVAPSAANYIFPSPNSELLTNKLF